MELFLVMTVLSGIQIKVIWGANNVRGHEHESLTFCCGYDEDYISNAKYFCKVERFKQCLSLSFSLKNSRISLLENRRNRSFCITMKNLTVQDSGLYWFAIIRHNKSPQLVPVRINVEVRPVIPTKSSAEITSKAAATITDMTSMEPTDISLHTVVKPFQNTSSSQKKEPGFDWLGWLDILSILGISTGLLLLILCIALILTEAWRRARCIQQIEAKRDRLKSFEDVTEIMYAEVMNRRSSQALCDLNTYVNLSYDSNAQEVSPGGSTEYAAIKH
ncbi:hypothetical protein JZ751_017404 [Albula glossodonta]|uniref:Uncharacterized protein n=1 Tax=Albula glossodonta TaxID=121402 RepID=A0A8T2PNT6_9TELE|nr:hypothetical protein JZ751_017404 [Albula glossodonta]